MRREQGMLTTSDNQKIAYTHLRNGHSRVVIIAHGFYNSKDAVLLQQLAAAVSVAYDVMLFDFRGHGKSSGFFSWMSKEVCDIEAVLSYLQGKYRSIGVIAFSLGGSIWINALSQKPRVDSLICVSAPSSFEKIDYRFWALNWDEDIIYTLLSPEGRKGKGIRPGPFWLKKSKPIDLVAKLTVPTLYIHGDKDWVIDPWHSKTLYERATCRKKLVIIEGGSHAEYLLRNHQEKFIAEIRTWLQETLKEVK